MSVTRESRQPRYWDDVTEGDEIPGFELYLSETKMVEQVSGSQDFYPVHHDREFARAGGHEDVFFNTGFTRAALGRLLGDYVGTEGCDAAPGVLDAAHEPSGRYDSGARQSDQEVSGRRRDGIVGP